jgi:hypothetical protein
MKPQRVPLVAVLGLLVGFPAVGQAGPLNPSAFASLGAFPTAPGTYTFNTSGIPTLTGPGGINTSGVVGPDDIAVFTFNSIRVGDSISVVGTGTRPLALLSYGDVVVSGTGVIDVSALPSPLADPGVGREGGEDYRHSQPPAKASAAAGPSAAAASAGPAVAPRAAAPTATSPCCSRAAAAAAGRSPSVDRTMVAAAAGRWRSVR